MYPSLKNSTTNVIYHTKVKEETIKDFDAHEQIGIDLITSKDFDYVSNESKVSANIEEMT